LVISEVMTRDVRIVSPDDTRESVARFREEQDFGSLRLAPNSCRPSASLPRRGSILATARVNRHGGRMRYQRGIVFAMTAAVYLASGCTTRSYTPTTDAATHELKIRAGDEIRVVTTQRERLSFKVQEVRSDRFVGVTVEPHRKEHRSAGQTVEVPFDELAVLEVTRFEARTATAAAVAVLLTVSAFAVVTGPAVLFPPMPGAP